MSFLGKHSAFVENANPIEAQCLNKQAFRSKAAALNVALARAPKWKKGRRAPERAVPREPYHCRFCGAWHLGRRDW